MMQEIDTTQMEESLIELWSNDPELQVGVPYRRMASEAIDCVISYLHSLSVQEDEAQNEEVQAMEDYIANAMGELGVEAVEFADEDGNVAHTIECKPNLKFIPKETDE